MDRVEGVPETESLTLDVAEVASINASNQALDEVYKFDKSQSATGESAQGSAQADITSAPFRVERVNPLESDGAAYRISLDLDSDGSEFDDLARLKLGEQTWLNSPYSNVLANGRHAGADFVSQVIKDYMGGMDDSLYDILGLGLYQKLEASSDFKSVEPAPGKLKPGDILFAFRDQLDKPYKGSMVGVVGDNNKLMLNSSQQEGRIIEIPLNSIWSDSSRFRGGFKAFRPPAEIKVKDTE